MSIGPQEIAVFVGLLLVLGFVFWVKGKINKNNSSQNQNQKQ